MQDLLSLRMRRQSTVTQPLQKCKRAFQALITLSMAELCETAESLIAPVRMGVVRPTAPFSLVSAPIDAISGSEELFSVEPLPQRAAGGATGSGSAADGGGLSDSPDVSMTAQDNSGMSHTNYSISGT